MTQPQRKTWPVTGHCRTFTEDQARAFDKASELVAAHGKPGSAFKDYHYRGERSDLTVAAFRIEQVVLAGGPKDRKVEITVTFNGRKVFQASREQWRRPGRPGELTLDCAAQTFDHGEWQTKLLHLR